MNNQKILVKAEDFNPEDVSGYQGTFFTDATPEEIRWSARECFKFSDADLGGKLYLLESDKVGVGTTLRILANKTKFEELTELVSRGFVTRVDCFGAGETLHHIDDVIRNLLLQGKRVVLFPFTKDKHNPSGPQTIRLC